MGDQKKESEWKKLKLISVAFKEASLDTPSFRASVNFFQTRVEDFEDWIEKTIDFTENKYSATVEDFQRAEDTYLSQLLPSPVILSNGFVSNQAYTPLFIDSFNKIYFEFTNKIFKMICGSGSGYPNALLELMNNAIEPYKSKRANFEYYQGKYDNILGKYQAVRVSNTSIEASAIREDAFQVFEVRKGYLEASLDLIAAISVMKLGLDRFLVEVLTLVQSKNTFVIKESGKKIDLMPPVSEKLKAYSQWVQNAIEASHSLEKDVEHAKQQVMEYSMSHAAPSREINDYNIKAINFSTLLNENLEERTTPPEKSGWLYMKTTVGTPSRQVWVRRWCFLKKSVFGIFLLSLPKTYVEETDKFGILLTRIRYDPDEDRKFCFEVKIFESNSADTYGNTTSDIHLVFQAESLQDLRSWLNTFESAKRYVMKLDQNSTEYDMACKRFSPDFFEFASSTTTSTDQLITTYSDETISLLNELDENMPDYDITSISGGKLYQFQMAMTPISTKVTQMAILGNLYRTVNSVPNAISANIWGTTNWGDYAIFNEADEHLYEASTKKQQPSPSEGAVNYPEYYSKEKRISDIQFKSLFFTINQNLSKFPDELLLFNFSAFWCPNKKQKFSAVCYVTVDHLYCYMNSMGFVCLTHKSLGDLVSVEPDKTSDNLLKIYDVEGVQLRMYIFFTDRRLVVAKLQFLLENKALLKPRGEEELLKKLLQIDNEFQENKQKEKYDEIPISLPSKTNTSTPTSPRGDLPKSFWSMSATAADLSERRKKLQTEYTVMYHHPYEISSKGLMHIMFGDQSTAFPRCLFLADKDHIHNISSSWSEKEIGDTEPQLVRELHFNVNMTDNFLTDLHRVRSRQITIRQTIVKMVENRYYEVDQDPIFIKVPFCNTMRILAKYLIVEPHEAQNALSASASLLYVYYKLEYVDPATGHVIQCHSRIEDIALGWAAKFTSIEFLLIRKVIKNYLEKIGKHGKVIKAIKLCGMLGVIDNQSEVNGSKQGENQKELTSAASEKPQRNEVHYSISIILKVLLKLLVYRITNLTFVFIRLIIGLIYMMISNVTQINRTLLLGLMISITFNFFLSGKLSVSYWSVKRAENVFHEYMEGSTENTMQRAISIKDLDLLAANLAFENDNLPFKKFNETSSAEIHKYRDTRRKIASRRNELLVELKILQNMERELVQGHYRNFLVNEIDKCRVIQKEMLPIWANDTQLQDYCCSCNGELQRLTSLLL